MINSPKQTVAPTREVMTLDEFKGYQRVHNDSDEERLMEELNNARHFVEEHTGLVLSESTYECAQANFDGAMGAIKLPIAPIRSIVKLEHYNTSGALTTISSANYRLHDHTLVQTITPATGVLWPLVEINRPDGVIVTVVAGCVADGDTSSSELTMSRYHIAKRAIAMLASHLFENGLIAPIQLYKTPMAFQALLNTCRLEFL